jgi:hypothetical protein
MKALAHLVPQAEAPAAFAQRIRSLADELREQAGERGVTVNVMQRLEKDPFGSGTPFHAALELTGEGADVATLAALVAGLGKRLDDVADLGRSTLLVGEGVVFVASEAAPVRYQYLMRRNDRFDHASYLARYRKIHSDFGVRTPGKRGYVQFHVDPEASRQAAGAAGLSLWDVDSVSELHLESLETFIGEVSHWSGGKEAIADEQVFVDRLRSFDFCSSVDWAPTRG